MLEQYDEHRLGNSVAVAARIIYRLSKLVPDNMDRSGLFSFFSKELRASFHYDRFSIFLYDAERDFLTAFTAADGTVVEVFSDTRIAQNTVAWQAIQTRKPVVIKIYLAELGRCGFSGFGGAYRHYCPAAHSQPSGHRYAARLICAPT